MAESFIATRKAECFGEGIPPTSAGAKFHGLR